MLLITSYKKKRVGKSGSFSIKYNILKIDKYRKEIDEWNTENILLAVLLCYCQAFVYLEHLLKDPN